MTPTGRPKLIVSGPSLQNLAETLDKHTNAKFAAKREAKVAKEWGDLSENSVYKASKEKFRLAGKLQQRVGRELKRMQEEGYDVVDPLDWATGGKPQRVEVGVVVRLRQKGLAEEYLVAGAKDTHLPMDGALVPVPYTSPLGQAVYGLSAPCRVEAQIAGESRVLEIEAIRAPTRAEIVELYPELAEEELKPAKKRKKSGGTRPESRR